MNLDLSNTEQRQVHQAMTDIESGCTLLHDLIDDVINLIPASKFDELRAARGTIADALYRLTELFYNEQLREADPSPFADDLVQRALSLAVGCEHVEADNASPAGIERPILYFGIVPHPCMSPGCESWVSYDDEPYCFTHSPDEGSSVIGYSWLAVHNVQSHEMRQRAHQYAQQLERGVVTHDEYVANLNALIAEAHA